MQSENGRFCKIYVLTVKENVNFCNSQKPVVKCGDSFAKQRRQESNEIDKDRKHWLCMSPCMSILFWLIIHGAYTLVKQQREMTIFNLKSDSLFFNNFSTLSFLDESFPRTKSLEFSEECRFAKITLDKKN